MSLHSLWSKAVGTPGYDKAEWLALEKAWTTMVRREIKEMVGSESVEPKTYRPMMTRESVIEHLCTTMAIAYRSLDDYTNPSDGVCAACERGQFGDCRNDGSIAEYVRLAVVEKLVRDGHSGKVLEALAELFKAVPRVGGE